MKSKAFIFIVSLIVCLASCTQRSRQANNIYIHAEEIMPQHPDSALSLLSTLQNVDDLSEKDRAMYYLLLTEAENKTFVKHPSDSLIAIATEYFDRSEDWRRKAKAWYYRGRVNQDLGDALHAQDYYLKALQDEDKVEDYALMGRIYNSIGMLYTYQEVYEKAIPYLKRSLNQFELLKDSVGQLFVLRDIGRAFTALERRDSAIFYYESALVFGKEMNKRSIYSELGNLYMQIGFYEKAYSYIRKSLSLPVKHYSQDPTYLILGEFYMRTSQRDSAYHYLNYCTKSSKLDTKAGAFYYLSELEKEQENWYGYAQNHIQYEILRDSVNTIKHAKSIRKMQELYDYHQAESKLLYATISLDKMRIYYLFLGIVFLLVLLVAVIMVLFLRRNLENKKRHIEEQKERLLVLREKQQKSWMQIAENEKTIKELESRLQESSFTCDEQEKELMLLRKQRLELKNQDLKYADTEKELLIKQFYVSDVYYRFHLKEEWKPRLEDWAELFDTLDDVYDNFTHRLMGIVPRLTMTELRVSCLIKANVPPVIIAMLIVTTRTNVSMIRKRLYEKIFSEKGSAEKFDRFIHDF